MGLNLWIQLKMHGVHVPHHKNTAAMPAVIMDCPKSVTIPMSMHIGTPARPLVKVGEYVKMGQRIAEADGFVSSPVHASISGTVKKIDSFLASNGRRIPPVYHNQQEFLQALTDSGIVGLGGAGFPPSVKLTVKNMAKIDAVIVNGAECEPYITSDTRTMLDQSRLVMEGARILQHQLKAPKILFAIEDNKPECIALFEKLCAAEDAMEVCSLPSMYPQGGEKVLIYHTMGRLVPEGKLPIDVGAIVINVTTLASIARYLEHGLPLVRKCITVDGSAVKEPKNVVAPIGASLADVFAFCGGFKAEPKKVLYGGPMMGIAVPDLSEPILKNTNAILAFAEDEATPPKTTACIRCGRCIGHCPLRLMPAEVEDAYAAGDVEKLAALKVNLCMECGCCSYICPAHRPLVQTNRLAKAKVAAYLREQKQKEAAAK